VEVLDTWRVLGMRGTASHDWTVSGGFVPAELTEQTQVVARREAHRPWRGTLYRFPLTSITALHFSAVALGLGRRAIEALVDLAGVKTPTRSAALLRERVQVQDAVARAEVALESARAYRDRVLAAAWQSVAEGDGLSLEQRARLRLAGVNAGESAARAVDLMFGAGGTTAIEDASPLSRSFRDLHVVTNSVNLLPLQYELIGRVLLGMELGTTSPF
jgi:alkylation response protein AidB-like acyl-CoA dehydrogenase